MKKTSSLLFCSFLSMAVPSGAATIAEWNFDTTTESWTGVATSALTVTSGSLTGTATSNDPQLVRSSLTISLTGSQTWDQLIFRVRETAFAPHGTDGFTDGDTVPTFNATGLILSFNGNGTANSGLFYNATSQFSGVASGDGFFTVSVDLSTMPSNTTITSMRVDPIGGASSNSNSETNGNAFEVDFIQITSIPEPSSALLVGIGLVALIRRRR